MEQSCHPKSQTAINENKASPCEKTKQFLLSAGETLSGTKSLRPQEPIDQNYTSI